MKKTLVDKWELFDNEEGEKAALVAEKAIKEFEKDILAAFKKLMDAKEKSMESPNSGSWDSEFSYNFERRAAHVIARHGKNLEIAQHMEAISW